MKRSVRALLTVFLSLLLLGMQLEAERHALSHWSASLADHQEQTWRPLNDQPCPECALLAGGAHGIHGDNTLAAVAAIDLAPSARMALSAPSSTPSFYRSRAPPVLL